MKWLICSKVVTERGGIGGESEGEGAFYFRQNNDIICNHLFFVIVKGYSFFIDYLSIIDSIEMLT